MDFWKLNDIVMRDGKETSIKLSEQELFDLVLKYKEIVSNVNVAMKDAYSHDYDGVIYDNVHNIITLGKDVYDAIITGKSLTEKQQSYINDSTAKYNIITYLFEIDVQRSSIAKDNGKHRLSYFDIINVRYMARPGIIELHLDDINLSMFCKSTPTVESLIAFNIASIM